MGGGGRGVIVGECLSPPPKMFCFAVPPHHSAANRVRGGTPNNCGGIVPIMKIFADDEAGLLPADLKRGVLSEDGIWNLLVDVRELDYLMKVTAKKKK